MKDNSPFLDHVKHENWSKNPTKIMSIINEHGVVIILSSCVLLSSTCVLIGFTKFKIIRTLSGLPNKVDNCL